MGAASSSGLVDSVLDGDIQRLKTILHSHEDEGKDSAWELELEEAVHTVVASDLESGQHLQQLLIALELLLHTRAGVWSSTASSQDFNDDNDDRNDTSATSNSAGWSACHRACATGNLAFVAFVLQHHPAQFELQIRDAFGLFPIDLVPPELLMSAEEVAENLRDEADSLKPGTARTRRCLAVQRLRERKAKLQDEQVRSLLGESQLAATSLMSNQEEETPRTCEFYVAFEPRREHLSDDQSCNMGHVHERGALLRVNYRVPRTELFLHGYFQLIWRELGDPRSEEPHYDSRVTRLRDENARFLDQEAPVKPQQPMPLHEDQEVQIETGEVLISRTFDDPNVSPVVEGCFTVDVTHLPADSVCHVLFIACDRRMLHRTIALSTEGLAIQPPDINDSDSDDYFSDSTSEDEYEQAASKQKQRLETKTQPGYTFFVGGEEFSHPNSVFAGQSFPHVEAFESFLRDLRLKKQRRLQEKQEQQVRLGQVRKQDMIVQQQQTGQEVVSKSDRSKIPATWQEDVTRPTEKFTDNGEHNYNNEEDYDTRD